MASDRKSQVESREDLEQEQRAGTPGEPENASQPAVEVESGAERDGVAAGSAELRELQEERKHLLDRLARLQAEFDNYRKRQAREQQEFRSYALSDALRSLLPILDSFDRALATTAAEPGDLRGGVELIHKQLHDALARLGVQPVEAAPGTAFDPRLHEAIEMVNTTEAADNTVLDVLQRGYLLRDRLLRPAMVRVANNPGGNE